MVVHSPPVCSGYLVAVCSANSAGREEVLQLGFLPNPASCIPTKKACHYSVPRRYLVLGESFVLRQMITCLNVSDYEKSAVLSSNNTWWERLRIGGVSAKPLMCASYARKSVYPKERERLREI